MKPRLFIVLIVVIGLLAAMSSAAAAQAPSGGDRSGFPPAFAPQLTDPSVEPERPFDPEGGRPWGNPAVGSLVQPAAAPDAPAVALGQPGLSFRYERTFGETEVPYFDDPNHLFGPTGIATDGKNLWVAENMGRRALKYKSDGTFLMQFGKAGFREFAGTTLSGMSDVAVDKDGNIWVTDFSHHVVKFDPTGKRLQELGQTWNSGTANDRFNSPYGIAFDSGGNIFVSDSNNHRIQVFDSGGGYRTTIGVTGVSGSDNAHFNYPRHITIDTNNRLFVADADNHRVQIFDVSNVGAITYQATLGVSAVSGSDNAHLNSPYGAVADIARGRIYVADGYNWRVQVFDYATRAYLRTVIDDSSFTEDVAVDSDSNLYLAKSWGQSVVRQYNRDLNFVRNFGTYDESYLTDGYHYEQPAVVAAAADGSIYIGESEGRRLVKLNAAGSPAWIKGEAGYWGSDNDHFSYVDDVALDGAGRVYAVDTANHRVQIFLSDGSYYATLGGSQGTGDNQLNRPQGVAIAPDGTIYVADTSNHRIQVFDGSRNYLECCVLDRQFRYNPFRPDVIVV